MKVGKHTIGPGNPVYVIAEIGINHNGEIDLAHDMIREAADAGCQAVKFQKRTVDVVYTQEELDRPRPSPFGHTNGDLKRGLEFGGREYGQIDQWCKDFGIDWFASPWDIGSVRFLESFDPIAYKVAGPCLTDLNLIRAMSCNRRPLFVSCGMSTPEEILRTMDAAIDLAPMAFLHCVSSYPTEPSDVNLYCIPKLQQLTGCPVGYSGHEMGTAISIAAVALGASVIERHFTLDRSMWGSDQKVSLEPEELAAMVEGIREVEAALGSGEIRRQECEIAAWEKLRRVHCGEKDCHPG